MAKSCRQSRTMKSKSGIEIWINSCLVRARANTARFRRVTHPQSCISSSSPSPAVRRTSRGIPHRSDRSTRAEAKNASAHPRVASPLRRRRPPRSVVARRGARARRLPPSSLARSHPHAPRARDRRRALDSEGKARHTPTRGRIAGDDRGRHSRARDRRETRAKRATKARRRANRADGARGRAGAILAWSLSLVLNL